MTSYKSTPIFRALTILPFLILSIIAFGQKPNIIYILTDDLGYGDVSAYNTKSKITTPSIDALSKEGMLFTDAHSNSSVCTPTRYGILTGQYAWRTSLKNGVLWSYDKPLITPDQLTVAQLLKNKGYQTACIGKWHLGLDWAKQSNEAIDFTKPINGGPTQLGFDYFFGITASLDIPPYVYINGNTITATRIDSIKEQGGQGFWRAGPIGNDFKHQDVLDTFVSKSIQYIEKASQQKDPFFLYLALASPHTPILPSNSHVGKTGTNAYGDFVAMTDEKVGQILRFLKDKNLDKNTMIVFTSDNGCSPSANFKELREKGHDPSGGFRGTKADIYEGGHRIPFIVKWPGVVKANSISSATICLTDFMATCSDILGMPLQNSVTQDSYSLLPLLTPSKKTNYQRTSTIHHSIDGYFAIRKGDWKLAICSGSGGWSAPTENQARKNNLPAVQLYNLKEDPTEQNNLHNKYPEIVRALTAELEKIKANKK
jgi:arylsulfatase A-like enzyme